MAATAEVERSLWHAFDALDIDSSGQVRKSRLKVLINNIGRLFGEEKGENILSEDDERVSLSFADFFEVVQKNFLSPLSEELPNSMTLRTTIHRVDEICWMLCQARYLKRNNIVQKCRLGDQDVFKIWKVFNFLSEVGSDHKLLVPLRVDIEETVRVCHLMSQACGLLDNNHGDNISDGSHNLLDFVSFLLKVESCFDQQSDKELSHGVREVFAEIVLDTMKKGMLVKYGNRVTLWKERWFTLTPTELKYYTSSEEKELKGVVEITDDVKVESLPEKAGAKSNRLSVVTGGKHYELSAPDLRAKNEWITAINKAIKHVNKTDSLQRQAWWERKQTREARRKATAEEELHRQQERELMEKQQKELEEEKLRHLQDKELLEKHAQDLEAERQARADVEARLQEEAHQRELEQQRLRELEEIRRELEQLLEEERQAKHDEEIVRNLQARILEEEFQKREELERLKVQQDELLQQERQERAGLQLAQEEQQRLLQDATRRLEELEAERTTADDQLKEAVEKLRLAEEERTKMESRLKLRQIPTPGLARPLPLQNPNPFVTHRGLGAFVESEFYKSVSSDGTVTEEKDTVPEINSDSQDGDESSVSKQDNIEEERNLVNLSGSEEVNHLGEIPDDAKTSNGAKTPDGAETPEELAAEADCEFEEMIDNVERPGMKQNTMVDVAEVASV